MAVPRQFLGGYRQLQNAATGSFRAATTRGGQTADAHRLCRGVRGDLL